MNPTLSKFVRLALVVPFGLLVGTKISTFLSWMECEWGMWGFVLQSWLVTIGFVVVAMVIRSLLTLLIRLVIGWILGERVVSIRLFNLEWYRFGRKHFWWHHGLVMTCGSRTAPAGEKCSLLHELVLAMDGVLANLSVGFVLVFVSAAVEHLPLLSTLFYVMAILGLLMALLYGIPMRMPNRNAGYYAWELMRRPKAYRASWLSRKILKEDLQGVWLKDMPAEWFEIPAEEDLGNGPLMHIGVLACERLMDELRFEEAARVADYLLQAKNYRKEFLTCDRICCELVGENRREVLAALMTPAYRSWLQKAAKSTMSAWTVQYMYMLLHEGNREEAQRALEELHRCAKRQISEATVQEELALIEYADCIARQRSGY